MAPGLSEPIVQAVQRSVLAAFPADMLETLLADAMRLDVPAGSVMYREGDAARCGLLVSGLARIFLAAPDGRQVTIRYMLPGSLSGSALVVIGPSVARMQAVSDIGALMLNAGRIQALAQVDARVAWALATEVARSQDEIMRAFGISMFGTVRQRLVRHLLDLASAELETSSVLVATVTQQQLADAIGSSREVVARILGAARDDGLVRTARGGVQLLDPGRLYAELDAYQPV